MYEVRRSTRLAERRNTELPAPSIPQEPKTVTRRSRKVGGARPSGVVRANPDASRRTTILGRDDNAKRTVTSAIIRGTVLYDEEKVNGNASVRRTFRTGATPRIKPEPENAVAVPKPRRSARLAAQRSTLMPIEDPLRGMEKPQRKCWKVLPNPGKENSEARKKSRRKEQEENREPQNPAKAKRSRRSSTRKVENLKKQNPERTEKLPKSSSNFVPSLNEHQRNSTETRESGKKASQNRKRSTWETEKYDRSAAKTSKNRQESNLEVIQNTHKCADVLKASVNPREQNSEDHPKSRGQPVKAFENNQDRAPLKSRKSQRSIHKGFEDFRDRPREDSEPRCSASKVPENNEDLRPMKNRKSRRGVSQGFDDCRGRAGENSKSHCSAPKASESIHNRDLVENRKSRRDVSQGFEDCRDRVREKSYKRTPKIFEDQQGHVPMKNPQPYRNAVDEFAALLERNLEPKASKGDFNASVERARNSVPCRKIPHASSTRANRHEVVFEERVKSRSIVRDASANPKMITKDVRDIPPLLSAGVKRSAKSSGADLKRALSPKVTAKDAEKRGFTEEGPLLKGLREVPVTVTLMRKMFCLPVPRGTPHVNIARVFDIATVQRREAAFVALRNFRKDVKPCHFHELFPAESRNDRKRGV